MEIRALRCFVEVVRRQSFTAAAEALFVTQPTVSKMIRNLEDELGMALLNRDIGHRKRRVAPTEAGRRVLARAQEILASQRALEDDLQALGELRYGELTVGIPPLGATQFTAALSSFHQQWPGVELKLLESGSRELEKALRAEELECAVMLAPVAPDLDSISICDYPLCLVAPADSPWAARQAVPLADLAGTPFLLYGESFKLNEVIHRACARLGFTPEIACRSSQWEFIAAMVEYGMGIALLPEQYCKRLPAGRFTIRPLVKPEIRWSLALAWRREAHRSRALEAWLNTVRQHLPG